MPARDGLENRTAEEAGASFLKPYQVGETLSGHFGFKTPTGRIDGFLTRSDAERAAKSTEAHDRVEAETGIGPIAEVLRKYFAERGDA